MGISSSLQFAFVFDATLCIQGKGNDTEKGIYTEVKIVQTVQSDFGFATTPSHALGKTPWFFADDLEMVLEKKKQEVVDRE